MTEEFFTNFEKFVIKPLLYLVKPAVTAYLVGGMICVHLHPATSMAVGFTTGAVVLTIGFTLDHQTQER